jgi:AraC-like DNA-binding protein
MIIETTRSSIDWSVTLDQQVYRMEPGTLFVFQPYQLHHVSAKVSIESPYIRSVMQFDPLALQPYVKPFQKLGTFFDYVWKGSMYPQVFPQMQTRHPIEAVLQYTASSINYMPKRDLELHAGLLVQILQYLFAELHTLAIEIGAVPSRSLSHIEKILQWVELHYAEPLELERIADALHLSKYHISHLFKEETGRTVTEYVMARRSKEACRMLTGTSLPIAEIGVRVGWPIPSHFSQQFKHWVGCSPLQYRKKRDPTW